MDINFQFGDFFSDSSSLMDWTIQVISALIGAFATVFATWWLFNKTIGSQIENERKAQLQQVDEKIKYLKILIGNVIQTMEKQSTHLNDFINKTRDNPFLIPELVVIPNQDLERLISKINQSEYYHAFMSRFNNENDFASIFRQLDFFDVIMESTIESIKSTREYDYKRQKEYESIFISMRKHMNEIILSDDYTEDFKKRVHKVLSNINKGEKYITIVTLHQNFTLPIIELIHEVNNLNESIALLQRAIDLYMEIEKKNLIFAENMEVDKKNIDIALNQIKEASNALFA
jgi:hypothetical protein